MKSSIFALLAFILSAVCAQQVPPTQSPGQSSPSPLPLEQVLQPRFFPTPNEAALAVFPLSTAALQTPVQVHLTLLFSIVAREIEAACDDRALSFFGFKEIIDPILCQQPNRIIATSLNWYFSLSPFFPTILRDYATFLARVGVDPFLKSNNLSTPHGWARRSSQRVIAFAMNDGWNAYGDATRTFFRKRYADSTGYKPVNPGHVSPDKLDFPLRWQPLTQSYDDYGNFAVQKHVTPHIAYTVRPLALSNEEYVKLRAPRLYRQRNSYRSITPHDEARVRRMLKRLLKQSQTMTPDRLVRVIWWDVKVLSLGFFVPYYNFILGTTRRRAFRRALGDSLALHDGILVAWREKRRYDYMRPAPLLRRLFAGRNVTAWRGLDYGVGRIPVEEWEPAVLTMPHSEYPSASAVICSASLGHLELSLRDEYGANFTVPPFNLSIPTSTLDGFPPKPELSVFYSSLKDAAKDCGESRLYAGLHFHPAVDTGLKLGAMISRAALQVSTDLDEGRVPKHCHWCTGG